MSSTVLQMKPVGPVADAWRKSAAFVSGIQGPVGSGKTSTGVGKCFGIAMQQVPQPDGKGRFVRRARGAVIRDTYPNLDKTVLATWHSWVPRTVGKFSGDAPRTHKITVKLSESEYLELEMLFLAIGDNRVEDVLRGMELTFAWLNEADRLIPTVLSYLMGRVGRYPGKLAGGCVNPTIFMDFNAPEDVENWLYKLFYEEKIEAETIAALQAVIGARKIIEFFRQPGARETGAENLQNLPAGYYEMQYAAANKDYKDRMLDNKVGPMRHGQPVYPEFNFSLHRAMVPLQLDRSRKLTIGLDAGLTPAASFQQRTSLRQLRLLDELAVFPGADDMMGSVGPTRFGQALLQHIMDKSYHEALEIVIRYDPAAKDGTDKSGNEQSWIEIVEAQLKPLKALMNRTDFGGRREKRLRILPAPTNKLQVRLEALRAPMTRMVDGGLPGLVVSPACHVTVKGFVAGYHYQRVAVGGDKVGRYDFTPNKNMYSHVMDAAQYAALDDEQTVAEVMGRTLRSKTSRRVDSGSDYFGEG